MININQYLLRSILHKFEVWQDGTINLASVAFNISFF